MLEDEAVRRALHGVERPTTVAGHRELVRHYSDPLLALLLRSRAPERYLDHHRVEHAGGVAFDPADLELSPETRRRIRDVLGDESGKQ